MNALRENFDRYLLYHPEDIDTTKPLWLARDVMDLDALHDTGTNAVKLQRADAFERAAGFFKQFPQVFVAVADDDNINSRDVGETLAEYCPKTPVLVPKPGAFGTYSSVREALRNGVTLDDLTEGADTVKTNVVALPRRRGREPLSQETLENYLDEIGVTVRQNTISHKLEFTGVTAHWRKLKDSGQYLDVLPVKLRDELREDYTGCTTAEITDLLSVIGAENSFNPVLDFLNAEPWDGKSRIEALLEAMGISADDNISAETLTGWFLQGCALLNNTMECNYSAEGILTLQGRQGIGKTSFGRLMAIRPEWFGDGCKISTRDKDDVIRTTSFFISELGELEQTFRAADNEFLKSFITRPVDRIRHPYGRADVEKPRRTNIYATVNGDAFLTDPTGSRRYWVVNVDNMDLKKLSQIDAVQLWREFLSMWKAEEKAGRGGTCYRLSPSMRNELQERNEAYKALGKGEAEVQQILQEAEENPALYEWRNAGISEWMEHWEVFERRHLSSVVVGKALTGCGIPVTFKKTHGRMAKVRHLPFRL